jgi:hypothetical protein
MKVSVDCSGQRSQSGEYNKTTGKLGLRNFAAGPESTSGAAVTKDTGITQF